TSSTTPRQYPSPSDWASGGKYPTDAPESTASLSNPTSARSSRSARSASSSSTTTAFAMTPSDLDRSALELMKKALADRNGSRRVRGGGRGSPSGEVGPLRPARSAKRCDSGEWVTQPVGDPRPSPRTWRRHTSKPLSACTCDGELADRMVNGDELGAVGERAFDLNLLEHLRHAFHHVVASQDVEPRRHEVRHGPAVANPLEDLGRDQRQGFGIVQLEAAA